MKLINNLLFYPRKALCGAGFSEVRYRPGAGRAQQGRKLSNKPTLLEAFCRIAEANQAGVDAFMQAADRANICLNVSDMTNLAAEIRKLQARVFDVDAQQLAAALAPIACSPGADPLRTFQVGPDGAVDIVLEAGSEAKLTDGSVSGYFFGNPMRITGKLAEHSVPAALSKPAAESDGWIDWGGGKCPVSMDTLVDVKLRDGTVLSPSCAKFFRWDHNCYWNVCGDIVAYRVQRSAAEPISNPPATPDAEGFYPPSSKPVRAGVYRTWFTCLGSANTGFSYWSGSHWGNENATEETAARCSLSYSTADQSKHWKPL